MPTIAERVLPTSVNGAVPGTIEIETVVDGTGAVAHVRVATGADPAIARACVDALRQWKFTPAMSAGNPRTSLVRVVFAIAKGDGTGRPAVTADVKPLEYAPLQDRQPQAGQAGAAPVSPGSGIAWPAVVREVKPTYTPDAMRAKIQGQVEMEVIVDTDGTVAAVRVTKSLDPDLGLDRAAMIAARYWLFEPGRKGGVAVPTKVSLILEFKLH